MGKMNLISAVHNCLKWQTCYLRNVTPEGIQTLLPLTDVVNEHFSNKHILICIICQKSIFYDIGAKKIAHKHITDYF